MGVARIDSFSGEYRYLSNFCPAFIQWMGQWYPSTEHAYQAAKTLDADDREAIAKLATAGEAKKAGHRLQLREDWEEVKLGIMEEILRIKFADPVFGNRLKATEPAELIEGNYWGDRFWGVCEGKGENHLGKLLMKIRADLPEPKRKPNYRDVEDLI